jgi:hypothetical protein
MIYVQLESEPGRVRAAFDWICAALWRALLCFVMGPAAILVSIASGVPSTMPPQEPRERLNGE